MHTFRPMVWSRRLLSLAPGLASVAVLASATASHGEPWRLAIAPQTRFPIDVGGQLVLGAPGGVELLGSAGWLPGPYVRSLNAALVALGAYSSRTGRVIEAALENSLVLRGQVGWSAGESGFFVRAGYTRAALGGGLTAVDLLAAALGRAPPEDVPPDAPVLSVHSVLHMASGELGWRWRLAERLGLELSLGGFATLGARTRIELPGAELAGPLALFTREGEQFLDDVYRSHAHAATLGLALSYELF